MDKLKSKIKKYANQLPGSGGSSFQGPARTLGTAEPKPPPQRRPVPQAAPAPIQPAPPPAPSHTNQQQQVIHSQQQPPPAEAPEEVQAAISLLASSPNASSAADILYRLLRNIVTSPNEDKFRKIRLSNPKIQSAIVEIDGGVELLLACGFDIQFTENEPSSSLVQQQQQQQEEENEDSAVPSEGFAVLHNEADLYPLETALPLLAPLLSQPPLAAPPPPPASVQQNQHQMSNNSNSSVPQQQQQQQQPRTKPPKQYQAARHRNTQVLLPASVDADVPAWFFESTGKELKSLFVSAAKKRQDEQVLMTKAMRERALEKSRLPPPTHADIKIRLPEGISFRGEFNPGEPAVAVLAWVADCLVDPMQTFDLILPDRKTLAAAEKGGGEQTIKEAGLLPSVTLNLRWTGQSAVVMKQQSALREELLRAATTGQ